MNNVVIMIIMLSQPTTLSETPKSRSTGALSVPGSATGFALSPGADVTAAADIEGGGT